MSASKQDIEKARKLGEAAFAGGKKSVAAHDPKLMALLKAISRKIGDGIPILEAWDKGWTAANLRAPVPGKKSAAVMAESVAAKWLSKA